MLRAVWQQTPVALAVLNRHGHVDHLNPAMEAMLGYPAAAWRGASFSYFACLDDGHALRFCLAELLAGTRGSAQFPQRFRRRDGTVVDARLTMSAIHDDGRRPVAIVVTCEERDPAR